MSKQCDKTWVVVEHRGVVIEPGSVQLLSKAKAISPVPVVAVVLTTAADRDKLVAQLRPFGADQIMVVTDDSLNKKMTQETAAATLTQMMVQLGRPIALLFSATTWGRSVAPRVQGNVDAGLTADCVDLRFDNQTLIGIKPSYGDRIMCEITSDSVLPQMVTVRPNVFQAVQEGEPTPEDAIEQLAVTVKPDNQVVLNQRQENPLTDADNSLAATDIILALGRGANDPVTIQLAEKVAQKMGAKIGVTRPLVGDHFTQEQQIGQSGTTVAPKLIINLGISGAAQYTTGMSGAGTIVAVNVDPDAPIKEIADYYYPGEAQAFLQALDEAIN